MAYTRPTDIMFGRGPTCYNNPGNRVFRKLIKEHVVYYKNRASRKEKADVVKMVVSKLEAQGCRFLHQPMHGIWVEAHSHIVKRKVGHGLRDARLAVSQGGNNGDVLPKNFRPAIANESQDNIMISLTVETSSDKEWYARECDKTRTSKRWSLCFVQEVSEEGSPATFDHQPGDHMKSHIKGDFIRNASALQHDTSDVADVLGSAFNTFAAEGGNFWLGDDLVPVSSRGFYSEDGPDLCKWFRECS